MTNFFDSDIIQKELREINDLQEDLYQNVLSFGFMNREAKLEHVERLCLLVEKQKIMYTRLSLSDDPDAIQMKENLRKSISLMGFPPETDMNVLFSGMTKTIESLKKHLDG
jgi:hypothetical protein